MGEGKYVKGLSVGDICPDCGREITAYDTDGDGFIHWCRSDY